MLVSDRIWTPIENGPRGPYSIIEFGPPLIECGTPFKKLNYLVK